MRKNTATTHMFRLPFFCLIPINRECVDQVKVELNVVRLIKVTLYSRRSCHVVTAATITATSTTGTTMAAR